MNLHLQVAGLGDLLKQNSIGKQRRKGNWVRTKLGKPNNPRHARPSHLRIQGARAKAASH